MGQLGYPLAYPNRANELLGRVSMSQAQRQKTLDLRKRANQALLDREPMLALGYFNDALLDPTLSTYPDNAAALHCGRAAAYIALKAFDYGSSSLFEMNEQL